MLMIRMAALGSCCVLLLTGQAHAQPKADPLLLFPKVSVGHQPHKRLTEEEYRDRLNQIQVKSPGLVAKFSFAFLDLALPNGLDYTGYANRYDRNGPTDQNFEPIRGLHQDFKVTLCSPAELRGQFPAFQDVSHRYFGLAGSTLPWSVATYFNTAFRQGLVARLVFESISNRFDASAKRCGGKGGLIDTQAFSRLAECHEYPHHPEVFWRVVGVAGRTAGYKLNQPGDFFPESARLIQETDLLRSAVLSGWKCGSEVLRENVRAPGLAQAVADLAAHRHSTRELGASTSFALSYLAGCSQSARATQNLPQAGGPKGVNDWLRTFEADKDAKAANLFTHHLYEVLLAEAVAYANRLGTAEGEKRIGADRASVAQQQGFLAGWVVGLSDSRDSEILSRMRLAYNVGYTNGYERGYADGYTHGFKDGFNDGYTTAWREADRVILGLRNSLEEFRKSNESYQEQVNRLGAQLAANQQAREKLQRELDAMGNNPIGALLKDAAGLLKDAEPYLPVITSILAMF